MKKHSLMMNSLDFEGKETHNKLVIEQKDMYIKLLEDQLKLRDSLIVSEIPKLDEKILKRIKSFDQINSHFSGISSVSHSPIKKNTLSLPFIQPSRIPQPKNIDLSPTNKRNKEKSIKISGKKSYDNNYSNKYRSRNRIHSVESRFSDSSAASTYADNKVKLYNISDKYSGSPYVKSNLNFKMVNYKS